MHTERKTLSNWKKNNLFNKESNYMFLSCHVHMLEQIYTLQLPECQGTTCLKQALANLTKLLSVRSQTKQLWA